MIRSFTGEHRFLSNFFPSPVLVDGVIYPTVEHAYQAAKSRDPDHVRRILADPNPARAKRVGRAALLRPNWDAIKLDVMRLLVTAKFARGSVLANQLVLTDPHELVEGNSWGDTYWGVCRGVGANHLGMILMVVRAALAVR